MAIQPLGDRVLLKRLEAEEKTKGGIVLPDTAKEKPQKGEVVAVGKGKVLESGKVEPLEVKKGDKVLFGKYAGNEVSYKEEEYLILKEEDILAILK
ncbi:MAG: co-chaperone GroES [Candidatus Omnitrophica bacterium]|nr:co-chaperone GroES [Candidatus Omnitrophota bacterium]MBU1933376.1 co-chaperone GroES [Candidatus Omnitrophota bacterium]